MPGEITIDDLVFADDHPLPDDVEEFGTPTPSDEQLTSIEHSVNRAVELSKQITELELIVSELKADLRLHTDTYIPQLMEAAGCSHFTTKGGTEVKVQSVVAGSLPKDDELRAKALRWLEAAGASDIIKARLAVSLPRGSREDQESVRLFFKERGLDYQDEETVHAQTLAAFARERAKNGEDVPYELLGLYHGKQAKIERKK